MSDDEREMLTDLIGLAVALCAAIIAGVWLAHCQTGGWA